MHDDDRLKSRLGSTIARRNELQQQLLASVPDQDKSLLAGRISWLNRQIVSLRRNLRATINEQGHNRLGQRLDTVVMGVYIMDVDRFGLPERFKGQFEAAIDFNPLRTHYTLSDFSAEIARTPAFSNTLVTLAGLAAGTIDRKSGAVVLHLPLCLQCSVELPMGSYDEEAGIDFVLSTDGATPLNEAGWFTLQGCAAFASGLLQGRIASLSITGQFSALP